MIESYEKFIHIFPQITLLIGVFFCFTAAVGLIRMPDFLTKIHAIGISDSFGVPLILLSLIMINGINIISAKILLLIIMLYIFNPAVILELGNYFVNQSKNEESDDSTK